MKKHTLAVLRTLIGLKQDGMADLLGCSLPTIQSIEVGRLPLSEKLAETIAFQTGVSLEWLLRNETTAPPVGPYHVPDTNGVLHKESYTKAMFEQRQAELSRPKTDERDPINIRFQLAVTISEVAAIFETAYEKGKFDLYCYKIRTALFEIGGELTGDNVFHNGIIAASLKAKIRADKLDVSPIIKQFDAVFNKAVAESVKKAGRRKRGGGIAPQSAGFL